MSQVEGCIYSYPSAFFMAQDRFLGTLYPRIFLLDVDFPLRVFSTVISPPHICALLPLPRKETSETSLSQERRKRGSRAARGCSSPLGHLCGLRQQLQCLETSSKARDWPTARGEAKVTSTVSLERNSSGCSNPVIQTWLMCIEGRSGFIGDPGLWAVLAVGGEKKKESQRRKNRAQIQSWIPSQEH